MTQHALDRLDERIYLKYFRNFRMGEHKAKWLLRVSLQAVLEGMPCNAKEPEMIMRWWQGIMFVFKQAGPRLLLITVFPRNAPKKRQLIGVPKDLKLYLEAEKETT